MPRDDFKTAISYESEDRGRQFLLPRPNGPLTYNVLGALQGLIGHAQGTELTVELLDKDGREVVGHVSFDLKRLP